MMIELTQQQERVVDQVRAWLGSQTQTFLLGGYAGTGKTSLIDFMIKNGVFKRVVVCAPTGKAALVLSSKLHTPVSTIHSLFYRALESAGKDHVLYEKLIKEEDPREQKRIEEEYNRTKRSGPQFSFQLDSACPNDVIIVDEASMVQNDIYEDLLSTGCKILFVGDPGQLPPVSSKSWFIKAEFDAVLDEIHRQALESPIIRLSQDIRQANKSFDVLMNEYQYDDCMVANHDVEGHTWLQADQIITGKNVSRHRINKWMRSKKGYEDPSLHVGDRIICLSNVKDPDGMGYLYVNGGQAEIIRVRSDFFKNADCSILDIEYEGKVMMKQRIYKGHFRKTYDDSFVIPPYNYLKGYNQFDFSYAITCHKSQGSQWPFVIVADDVMTMGGAEQRKRWLYTAITRAQEKVIWIKRG